MRGFFLSFLLVTPAFGQDAPVYVNKNSTEAGLVMKKIADKDPKTLSSETELVEWARARLAWVSLSRLLGREKEALTIFEECGDVCGKYGPEKEWAAVKEWGCQKKREARPCLSLSIPTKTKAQKPPQ